MYPQTLGARWIPALVGTGTSSVTATAQVTSLGLWSSAGGTLTITPGGPNQAASANAAIVIPVGGSLSWDYPVVCALGPGTIFAFTGMDSIVITQSKNITGS